MKGKQGTVVGRAMLGAMFCVALTMQAQVVGDRATPQSPSPASPAAPAPANQESASPVNANAYQHQGPPGPSGCRGCFPVKPAGQGPNQEAGLPQAAQRQGGGNCACASSGSTADAAQSVALRSAAAERPCDRRQEQYRSRDGRGHQGRQDCRGGRAPESLKTQSRPSTSTATT